MDQTDRLLFLLSTGGGKVRRHDHGPACRAELPAGRRRRSRTRGSPGNPGETADLPHLPGTVHQAGGHSALPAQPVQEVCQ